MLHRHAHLGMDLGIRLIKIGNVLYDNIRLVGGDDMNPTPASGVTIAGGNVELNWTNTPPNTGTDTYVDVWFGTNPAALANVVNGGLNLRLQSVAENPKLRVGATLWRARAQASNFRFQ